MMRVLDLFSGIGAFSLGLERAGMTTTAFCEIDPFCRRVLAKHWPGVPCYDDVRSLTADRLRTDGISVDVICGGFPCQPHSVAGKRGAGADERDLWPEFARLIREVRPRWVLAENVPGLRSSESGRFFGGILRDLACAGYDAEWRSISAADVGAPHIRDRIWIVAYADSGCGPGWDHVAGIRGAVPSQGAIGELLGSNGWQAVAYPERAGSGAVAGVPGVPGDEGWRSGATGRASIRSEDWQACSAHAEPGGQLVADTAGARCSEGRREPGGEIRHTAWRSQPERLGGEVADADGGGWREQGDVSEAAGDTGAGQPRDCGALSVPVRPRLAIGPGTLREWSHAATAGDGIWAAERPICRVVDGASRQLDRRKRLIGLGNSLVPQIATLIGHAIMNVETNQ